jgi:hypothetical protein
MARVADTTEIHLTGVEEIQARNSWPPFWAMGGIPPCIINVQGACFSCGQMGHISCYCPNQAKASTLHAAEVESQDHDSGEALHVARAVVDN